MRLPMRSMRPSFLVSMWIEIAGMFMLVANHRLGRLQIAQAATARPRQNASHGALGHADRRGDTRWVRRRRRNSTIVSAVLGPDRSGTALGARGAVLQPSFSFCQVAPQPLARSRLAYAGLDGRFGRREPWFNDASDHFDSTCEGESGILVNVHSAELPEKWVWFAPPSLSDSVRMNRNNLLDHHS